MPTPAQIKIIHVLKGVLGLDDDTYRDVLGSYGAKSSKDLDFNRAKSLIERLQAQATSMGRWKPQNTRVGRTNNPNRPGWASYKQLGMIRGMWASVSRAPEGDARDRALDHFIERRFNVARLNWLPAAQVPKVIKALEVMQKQERIKDATHSQNASAEHSGGDSFVTAKQVENGSGECRPGNIDHRHLSGGDQPRGCNRDTISCPTIN